MAVPKPLSRGEGIYIWLFSGGLQGKRRVLAAGSAEKFGGKSE
jgi:hypothetical protein